MGKPVKMLLKQKYVSVARGAAHGILMDTESKGLVVRSFALLVPIPTSFTCTEGKFKGTTSALLEVI